MKRVFVYALGALLLMLGVGAGARRAVADEGMWLLPLLQKYNEASMQLMGLKMGVKDIYNEEGASLKDAIVQFGNGCTGEVISTKGLVLTNHHCGYGSIQKHSTVEHDYLKDGFWAMREEDEIPTPGLTITFLKKIEDVTAEVTEHLRNSMSEDVRDSLVRVAKKRLVEEAKSDKGYKVTVQSFYGGNRYYRLTYETFTDIRLVGAPPSSIGKFGADTDNWMYPRHTGDFSLFRIYAGADNRPAEYSPDNKPYRPEKALTISLNGYKEGDFAMIMGYPGSTTRYMTSWEVEQTMKVTNTDRALIRGVKQGVWMKHMEADPAVRIKYASKYARSANYWKNAIGQNEALEHLHVVRDKQKIEAEFNNWCVRDSESRLLYLDALSLIPKAVEALNAPHHLRMFYIEALIYGIELNQFAHRYSQLEKALGKHGDKELLEKIQKDVAENSEVLYKDYDMATDRATAKAMLKLFREHIPASELPGFYKTIAKEFKGDIDRYVDEMYDESIFASAERLKAFLANPKEKKLRKDLSAQMAAGTYTGVRAIMRGMKTADDQLQKGKRLFIAGRRGMFAGGASYPDANFTMRLTYGSVKGYSPRDAVEYDYLTTLDGVMEKEDPKNWEFVVPGKLKELWKNGDFGNYKLPNGKMPVAFLTTNDITGGNSGSPVMDAQGRLIGTAFDGNWESLSGDILFEKNLQRCINVDIRYTLFIIEKFAGCKRLIDEMHIERD